MLPILLETLAQFLKFPDSFFPPSEGTSDEDLKTNDISKLIRAASWVGDYPRLDVRAD
jgi:hypothetical protein